MNEYNNGALKLTFYGINIQPYTTGNIILHTCYNSKLQPKLKKLDICEPQANEYTPWHVLYRSNDASYHTQPIILQFIVCIIVSYIYKLIKFTRP